MNRLLSELQRLYAPPTPAEGRVRAMMLELARPADWATLGAVWRGVQADLALPAPAIAVNGSDGYQLWFSLADAVPAAQGLEFLEGLRRRYLDSLPARRLTLAVVTDSLALQPMSPAQQPSGMWSALLAPDLAPLFVDEPWLDTEPGADGQADLLCRLQSIKRADFAAALQQLAPAPAAIETPAAAPAPAAGPYQDPRHFLLAVMNDERVPLPLRIDAAKALLVRQ